MFVDTTDFMARSVFNVASLANAKLSVKGRSVFSEKLEAPHGVSFVVLTKCHESRLLRGN
jgi:hypothetical protein